jgi:UDP-N-acetylmuramate--alanine ligase
MAGTPDSVVEQRYAFGYSGEVKVPLPQLPARLQGYRVHLVGIKGTGMTALAEILAAQGAIISGSDVAERFYTDELLARLGVPVRESFSEDHVDSSVQLVVHSAAYSREANEELRAAARLAIPMLSYPEALGLLSLRYDSTGVCGTHGKTTTVAMAGAVLRALALPAIVVAGSAVADFGDRATLIDGERYLVAETCEYRRHFLNFHPRRIVMTSVEADHLDYYRDLQDVLEAFTAYGLCLPPGGQLLYHCDDRGAAEVARRVRGKRQDVQLIPYGEAAGGELKVLQVRELEGEVRFALAGFDGELAVHVPGRHSAFNAAAAAGLGLGLLRAEHGAVRPDDLLSIRQALGGFRGSRRRCELVGEARGVLFVDDYAHHPTEISATLAGLKSFYPSRRVVADFMPHTYSRTRALLAEFGSCFAAADAVVLHRIYASAREQADPSFDGRRLFEEVQRHRAEVYYFDAPEDAAGFLQGYLRPGDLFVTMGAGDNWKLGRTLYERSRDL